MLEWAKFARINRVFLFSGEKRGKRMSGLLIPTPQQQVIFDNLLNGVYFVDTQRKITYWNRAAEQISGYKAEDVLGKSCRDDILVHAMGSEILCNDHCPLIGTMECINPVGATVSLRHRDGYRVPVIVRCVPLLDEGNKIIGAVEVFEPAVVQEDITIRLKELGQIAYVDVLTGIPNRRYMEETLDDWLRAFRGKDWRFAVAMADIDFFKNVNDEYGHDAGDLVLKAVSNTLRSHLRSMDVVGRWGGEEFLILLQNIRLDKLNEKIETLRAAIENSLVEEKGNSIRVTMSFGCTVPRIDDTPATLVARADELLYRSKREGRNRSSLGE